MSIETLKQVNNIIAIASGKGGVGKSTISSNLAVSLAKKNKKVGLIDADIFGPSIPKMFDLEEEKPYVKEEDGKELIIPVEKYGVKILSIGFFVDKSNAVIWRGPMASNFLKQIIEQADWGELDYLLVDLPPGTSDIHLTLVQTVNLSGSIIVTTPQEVALADARKGVAMFRNEKINVPVIGLIENMSWFTPAELPENKYYIFGKDGGKTLSKELSVPLLGQVPLILTIREDSDAGRPAVLTEDQTVAGIFSEIADQAIQEIENRAFKINLSELK